MGDKELAINLLTQEKSRQSGRKQVEKQASVLNLIHNVSELEIIFQKFYKGICFKDFTYEVS